MERRNGAAGYQSSVLDATRRNAAPLPSYTDALREARTCLETAGRRLRRGEAEHADEVLSLLQAATSHLRRAMSPATVEALPYSE